LSLIIAAAGQGKRLGRGVNKVFLPLAGKPILAYSLAAAAASPLVNEIVVVTRPEDIPRCRQVAAGAGGGKVRAIVAGGTERQDSIVQALQAVAPAAEWVAVHDGARPFLTMELLARVIMAARATGAAIAALPVKETLKQGGAAGLVTATVERSGLWSVQTPQVFRREWLAEAYHEAVQRGWQATDDAALVERLGYPVQLVPGEETNIKITTPGDLTLAGALLGGEG